MRILLTNNALDITAGTELYAMEIATELKARGHEPACFTLWSGRLAKRLEAAGVPVSDDLRALPKPDVVHGQHFIETTMAAMTYRTVPVVSFCHGPERWEESACRLPNVVQWIAVDEACRRRLIEEEGIEPEKVLTLPNHFDDRRFQPRDPLPERPRKALIVSNDLTEEHPATRAARAACRARGMSVETVGAHFGGQCDSLETMLPHFDLVFAKARCAIEAMGVGCAVVQLAHFGAGHLVTSARYDTLRALNFGYRSMTEPLTEEHIGAQIDDYNATDASRVSGRIRTEATLSRNVDTLLSVYWRTLTDPKPADYDPAVAAADFLRFHLFLSKLPFLRLDKTVGVPLRLPHYQIAPGEIVATWKRIESCHPGRQDTSSWTARIRRALRW
jgi:hypothetical protein